MIHIVSEVVALLGITFYFNQQNKRLKGYIEDLAQRMEEQEDSLKRQEDMIKTMANLLNNLQTQGRDPPQQPKPPPRGNASRETVQVLQLDPVQSHPQSRNQKSRSTPKVRIQDEPEVIPPMPELISDVPRDDITRESESESESDSDIDAELQQELEELDSDEDDEDSEDNLKKES